MHQNNINKITCTKMRLVKFMKLFPKSNLSTSLTSLDRVSYLSYSCRTLCDLNRWAGSVFRTSVGNPAAFKAELSVPGKP